MRGEIDSVRTAVGRKGATTDGAGAAGAAVAAGTAAVGTESSLGDPAVYVSVESQPLGPGSPDAPTTDAHLTRSHG